MSLKCPVFEALLYHIHAKIILLLLTDSSVLLDRFVLVLLLLFMHRYFEICFMYGILRTWACALCHYAIFKNLEAY
jgi:hypothetical protein